MRIVNASKVLMIVIVLVMTSFVILSVPAYAHGNTNGANSDAFTCANYFSPAQVYDRSTSTCTISGVTTLSATSPATINFYTNIIVTEGGSLRITQGHSFSLRGSFTIGGNGQLIVGGTFDNRGTTTVQPGGESVTSIVNNEGGVFINRGTLALGNSYASFGFANYGNFANRGTVTIDNTNALSDYGPISVGFVNYPAGTCTNYGTMTISNTGGTIGLSNLGLFNNYGVININSGLYSRFGFWNFRGTFNNYGSVTITGCGGYEFCDTGTVNNYGSITISNKASTSPTDTGLYVPSGNSFYNYGSIYIYDATGQALVGNIIEENGGTIVYSST